MLEDDVDNDYLLKSLYEATKTQLEKAGKSDGFKYGIRALRELLQRDYNKSGVLAATEWKTRAKLWGIDTATLLTTLPAAAREEIESNPFWAW